MKWDKLTDKCWDTCLFWRLLCFALTRLWCVQQFSDFFLVWSNSSHLIRDFLEQRRVTSKLFLISCWTDAIFFISLAFSFRFDAISLTKFMTSWSTEEFDTISCFTSSISLAFSCWTDAIFLVSLAFSCCFSVILAVSYASIFWAFSCCCSLISCWTDAIRSTKFTTSSSEEELHEFVSSVVDCASASNDIKTDRQITVNTRGWLEHYCLPAAWLRHVCLIAWTGSTDRVSLLMTGLFYHCADSAHYLPGSVITCVWCDRYQRPVELWIESYRHVTTALTSTARLQLNIARLITGHFENDLSTVRSTLHPPSI